MANQYNTLDSYYREVGEFSLLTREEETALGHKIQRGRKPSKKYIDELMTANLRLVVKIAQDFRGRGLDVEDLISEGNIGLQTAAKKFDPNKGAKFSYYSSFWIRQNILRAIANHGRLIRIPVCTLDKYYKIVNYTNDYKKKRGKEPSRKKLAKQFSISQKRLAQILEAVSPTMPLDAKVGTEGDTRIHEIITCGPNTSPDEIVEKKENHNTLLSMVEKLPDREKIIIRSRFSLNGKNKKTLENLGKELKITRERVRQLETIALNKLRIMAKKNL